MDEVREDLVGLEIGERVVLVDDEVFDSFQVVIGVDVEDGFEAVGGGKVPFGVCENMFENTKHYFLMRKFVMSGIVITKFRICNNCVIKANFRLIVNIENYVLKTI